MMAGVVPPTITPMLLLYARTMRNRAEGPLASSRIFAMAAGYVATWALFSVGATAPQRWFASRFAAEKSSSWLNIH
jgi:predicted metal-binding membrane protein